MSAVTAVPTPELRGGEVSQLAVIDLGSNTARLSIFEATGEGGLRTVYEVKELPRLGKGVRKDLSLSPAAIERGLATLVRFSRHLTVMGNPPTIAVATSAVRDAPNGPAFVERIARRTGILMRVISGEEEARLGYLGVASSWELDRDLTADLGGGSIQLASTRGGRLERSTSLPLGALRLTQDFLDHDPPKRRELETLQEYVQERLAATSLPRPAEKLRVFGVGGTIRCLARVAMELREYPVQRIHGYPLNRRDLEALQAILFEMSAPQRREVPGISAARADVIVAGLIVVQELLRRMGKEQLLVTGHGIREGAAVERLAIPVPASQEVLAFRSVTAAARAMGFSLVHGEQVRRLALTLFDRLRPRYGWSDDDRLVLSVASWMHDVGTVVDAWHHPQHSAYIIRNMANLSLTVRDAVLASLVAYLHEGDELPEGWAKTWRTVLTPDDLQVARQLGTMVYFSETLEGARLNLSLPRGSQRLRLEPHRHLGTTVPPRAVERLRKPIERVFELELVAPNE
ncbi:MAG: Ppx/GppA family phosphatase [Thermoplasmata archaeon]|nr:Ppx/GppA family phosphatase [Thermoplasmata archaeon]